MNRLAGLCTAALLGGTASAQVLVTDYTAGYLDPGTKAGEAVALDPIGLAAVSARVHDLFEGRVIVLRKGSLGPISLWIGEQVLEAPDGGPYEHFGYDVDLDGEVLIAGAPFHHHANDYGAAYVFEIGPDGVWYSFGELRNTGGSYNDFFGKAVGLSADRAAVAAPDVDHGLGTGSVYFYQRQGGWPPWGPSWVSAIEHTSGEIGARFGEDLDLEGQRLIVGAPGPSGRAYIYKFLSPSSMTVDEEATLSASSSGTGFGSAVAIDGNLALVGAPREPSTDVVGWVTGAVHVYRRDSSGDWNRVAELRPPDPQHDMYFGGSVEIQGTRAIVGTASHVAYVFGRVDLGSGQEWIYQAKLEHGGDDQLGASVALGGDWLLCGAPRTDSSSSTDVGAGLFFSMPAKASPYGFANEGDSPCGNDSGIAGSINSTGNGATLLARNSASVAADDLVLRGVGLPGGELCVLLQGGSAVRLPFGDGLRVVGGGSTGLARWLPPKTSSSNGEVSYSGLVANSASSLPSTHAIAAGDSWYFQLWYRDASFSAHTCGNATNLTNGMKVTFEP